MVDFTTEHKVGDRSKGRLFYLFLQSGVTIAALNYQYLIF